MDWHCGKVLYTIGLLWKGVLACFPNILTFSLHGSIPDLSFIFFYCLLGFGSMLTLKDFEISGLSCM